MDDDWKGEAAIRRVPSKRERYSMTCSVAASIAHKRRAANGSNMSAAGGPFAKAIKAWHLESRHNAERARAKQ